MGKYKVKVVNCYSLNVRSGPSTSNKVVQWAQRDDQFTSSKQSNGWYYLDEKKGWSKGDYIKVLSDLNPKPAPKPTPVPKTTPKPAPKPSPPPINYGKVNEALNAKNSGTKFNQLDMDRRIPEEYKSNLNLSSFKENDMKKSFGSADVTIANYNLDYEFIRSNMDIIRKNYNIVGEKANIRDNLFDRFNRFKVAFPDYHLTKTFSHVFFTRPSLYLLDGTGTQLCKQFEKDPLFYYLWKNSPKMIKSLTTHFSSKHDFHPYLSNAANSFELSDEVIKTMEHGSTFTGYKVQYGRHNVESNTAGQFSITYQDDADFNIYKTHKAWTEYISRVYRGSAKPIPNHIKHKVLDYACSVYFFVCAPDGETILFWTKYFGVFPTNTPSSAGSWRKGESSRLPEFSINYAYAIKEDFSPVALAEFNKNSSEDFVYKRVYEPDIRTTGPSLSGAPFIESSKDAYGSNVYKLKFRS